MSLIAVDGIPPAVVTLGEAMIAMVPLQGGPLRHVSRFEKRFGGAELNTAIGLCRLGTPARWISRLGDDEFGVDILRNARGEGVDVTRVRIDPDAPTAVYFREYRGAGGVVVHYYRRGSAASRIGPEDLDPASLAGARLLHFTGITPCLSESCEAACHRAVELARAAGLRISFDPNIRRKLIAPERVRPALRPFADAADVLLAGGDELEALYGGDVPPPARRDGASADAAPADPGPLRRALERARAAGPRVVVCKLGGDGAAALSDEGFVRQPAYPVTAAAVVDPIGAGDGFNAGFLHAWLRGSSTADALRWGAVVGACAVTVRGDVEGYPDAARAAALVASMDGSGGEVDR